MTIIVIAILAIIGTVVLFGRGNNNSSPAKVARQTKVADYENNDLASVSWTMQGKLVGDDQRAAVRVTVTRNKRTAEVLTGYGSRVERSIEQPNTAAAFATFTRALDNASFGRERTVKQPDDRGMCPLGNVFIYRLTEGSSEIMRSWSDSCRTTEGSFGGGPTTSLIQQLFKAQITDYSKFTSGVKI